MKGDGSTELREAGRFGLDDEDSSGGGATWIAYPDESMQRASHALVVDGDVWLVDPVDADDLDEWLDQFGEVVGVVVLLDRHTRDAAALARRHDVPVYVHGSMDSVAEDLDADVGRFGTELPGTGYRAFTVVDNRLWTEIALRDPERGTLVVPEAVGTAGFFRTDDERLGVHPALRPTPPRSALGGLAPERILVGHGDPVLADAGTALGTALDGARRRLPRLYVQNALDALS